MSLKKIRPVGTEFFFSMRTDRWTDCQTWQR